MAYLCATRSKQCVVDLEEADGAAAIEGDKTDERDARVPDKTGKTTQVFIKTFAEEMGLKMERGNIRYVS